MRLKKHRKSEGSVTMILGASHSGTTMLDLMLGNHQNTFSCGEVYAYYRPWREHHFNPTCACGGQPCNSWEKLLRVNEDGFHVAAATQPGITHVVDSSKELSWVLDSREWIKASGMQLNNVVIWKDPIHLAYSHWKRGKPLGAFRNAFLSYYERFLQQQIPFISVNYSQLTSNPGDTVRKLCQLTGLPWHEGQEKFWEKQHHHLFGSALTLKQVQKSESQIQSETKFPEEFLAEFEKLSWTLINDSRLMRVLGALESRSITQSFIGAAPHRVAAESNAPSSAIRPAWYYRHALKRVIRRHLPASYQETFRSGVAS